MTVLLQIFSWFRQWNNCKNRLIFGKVKAYNKWCQLFGPRCTCFISFRLRSNSCLTRSQDIVAQDQTPKPWLPFSTTYCAHWWQPNWICGQICLSRQSPVFGWLLPPRSEPPHWFSLINNGIVGPYLEGQTRHRSYQDPSLSIPSAISADVCCRNLDTACSKHGH